MAEQAFWFTYWQQQVNKLLIQEQQKLDQEIPIETTDGPSQRIKKHVIILWKKSHWNTVLDTSSSSSSDETGEPPTTENQKKTSYQLKPKVTATPDTTSSETKDEE